MAQRYVFAGNNPADDAGIMLLLNLYIERTLIYKLINTIHELSINCNMDFFTNRLFRLLKLSSMGKWLSLLLFLHTQITVAQIQANIHSAEFRCDSIYPDQHYKLVQQTFVNGLD